MLGPNGCGKSTLLRTLAGLQPALSGEYSLTGEAGLSVKRSFRETVFQAQPVKELLFLKDAPLFDISSTSIRRARGLE